MIIPLLPLAMAARLIREPNDPIALVKPLCFVGNPFLSLLEAGVVGNASSKSKTWVEEHAISSTLAFGLYNEVPFRCIAHNRRRKLHKLH